jgi:hypothetical protein
MLVVAVLLAGAAAAFTAVYRNYGTSASEDLYDAVGCYASGAASCANINRPVAPPQHSPPGACHHHGSVTSCPNYTQYHLRVPVLEEAYPRLPGSVPHWAGGRATTVIVPVGEPPRGGWPVVVYLSFLLNNTDRLEGWGPVYPKSQFPKGRPANDPLPNGITGLPGGLLDSPFANETYCSIDATVAALH